MNGSQPLPGETPIDDISGLIPVGVRTRAQLNEVEAENILDALINYLGGKPDSNLAPFDLDWCYRLHAEMFGRVWSWAGQRRRCELNLGVPHYRIEVDLQNLLDDLRYWKQNASMPVAEQAARLHHRAVVIHPFLNGNGRWSRLLGNIWLAQHDQPVVIWPEETIGTASVVRNAYLGAIRSADAGDILPLLQMQQRFAVAIDE